MPLITIDVDESIKNDVLQSLNNFPKDKIKINRDAMISPSELEKIDEEDEMPELDLDDNDYFMLLESGKIMYFNFDLVTDPEFDEEVEVRLEFENGRRFLAFFTSMELVESVIESEDYYFSGFVIVSQLDQTHIRTTIEELVHNEEFFDAFEEIDEDEERPSPRLFDPFRMN